MRTQLRPSVYLMAFGPSRHRAWIRGHWMLLEALGPSWSGGEPKAREFQILDHSMHVGSMPQVVPKKYVFRHVRCMPQAVPIRYHLRHVGNMPQAVPNVCLSGSRVMPFGGLWEAVLKLLGGRFGCTFLLALRSSLVCLNTKFTWSSCTAHIRCVSTCSMSQTEKFKTKSES